jgi:hypothetical protein
MQKERPELVRKLKNKKSSLGIPDRGNTIRYEMYVASGSKEVYPVWLSRQIKELFADDVVGGTHLYCLEKHYELDMYLMSSGSDNE